ncbi:Hypothetical protein SRAE_X000137600 [Strongyloides ratti]|uniref:Uncharacterized protein n=1 Tax=Strongyloides ratti TaxID=34506 RepID=A0A090KUT9_STRRB|nr:Hypothetical protein SRAE_X000137600 [Strongyloides ratti]CEF59630.1 Hypothetical protein SRAE_X000137600 [Strongyloides ratti]
MAYTRQRSKKSTDSNESFTTKIKDILACKNITIRRKINNSDNFPTTNKDSKNTTSKNNKMKKQKQKKGKGKEKEKEKLLLDTEFSPLSNLKTDSSDTSEKNDDAINDYQNKIDYCDTKKVNNVKKNSRGKSKKKVEENFDKNCTEDLHVNSKLLSQISILEELNNSMDNLEKIKMYINGPFIEAIMQTKDEETIKYYCEELYLYCNSINLNK